MLHIVVETTPRLGASPDFRALVSAMHRQSRRADTPNSTTSRVGFMSPPGAIQSDAITLRLFVIGVAGSDLRRASCFCRTWPNRPSSRRFYD